MKKHLPSPGAFALAAFLIWSFAAYGQHIEGQSAGQRSQASTTAPQILKIDPPNWWATMPRPMLLVRGLNLTSAKVHLSDPHLRIESTQISENARHRAAGDCEWALVGGAPRGLAVGVRLARLDTRRTLPGPADLYFRG
jgi:hypothetical protein